MVEVNSLRLCLDCNKPVKGRTDKKFCNDYCRNHYNNKLKATTHNLVRNINNALGKNRRILEDLLGENDEIIRVSKESMIQHGFQFRYYTHTYKNKKGTIYFFCYDYGYLPLEQDSCLVVKYKD
jgi:hypothetical protein